MLNRVFSLLVTISVAVFLAGAAAAFTLTNEEGKFTVEMPAQPEFKLTPGAAGNGIEFTTYVWQVDQGAKAWFIVYSVYPPNVSMSYDGAVDGAVDQVKGRLKSREQISVFGISGTEIMILAPDGTNIIRQRLFIVGNRLYQAIYVGLVGTEREPNVGAFVDSFRISR